MQHRFDVGLPIRFIYRNHCNMSKSPNPDSKRPNPRDYLSCPRISVFIPTLLGMLIAVFGTAWTFTLAFKPQPAPNPKSGLTTPFLVETRQKADRIFSEDRWQKEKILKLKRGLSKWIWYLDELPAVLSGLRGFLAGSR